MIERLHAWWQTGPTWKRWERAYYLTIACVSVPFALTIIIQTVIHGQRQPMAPATFYSLITFFVCGIIISNIVWTFWARARRKAGHRWIDIFMQRTPVNDD